jgi:hypothetical protein
MCILIIQQTALLLQGIQDHTGHDCKDTLIAHLTLNIPGNTCSCGTGLYQGRSCGL